jgi:hypothetical protein
MNFNIKHRPDYDIEAIIKHYSEKDNVKIIYVCSSALSEYGAESFDIFYRATPHPDFGNKYFGIIYRPYDDAMYITNADNVENLVFGMVFYDGKYYYSRSRHDFYEIPETNIFIDGGRAYIRCGRIPEMFKVKDGEFIKMEANQNEQ